MGSGRILRAVSFALCMREDLWANYRCVLGGNRHFTRCAKAHAPHFLACNSTKTPGSTFIFEIHR